MQPGTEKIKKLVTAAKMYYEEELTQAEVARHFAVSRPMVSKMLAEARDLGIVTIHIRDIESMQQMAEERLAEKYGLKQVCIIGGKADEGDVDEKIVRQACRVVLELIREDCCLGLGWGSMIGKLVNQLAEQKDLAVGNGVICPLIGNAGASYRSYHTNELVRIAAGKTGFIPHYLYAPAIAESQQEKELYEKTDAFGQVQELWNRLDLAVVNVSNYPSSPDMATAYRFGSRLAREKAVGHMVSHFYNEKGQFIEAENDCALSISTEALKRVGRVVAICAGGVNKASAVGALQTGLLSDLVISQGLAEQILKD